MPGLLLTIACLVTLGQTFHPTSEWTVVSITPQDASARVTLTRPLAVGEPFRWPDPGCRSVSLEDVS